MNTEISAFLASPPSMRMVDFSTKTIHKHKARKVTESTLCVFSHVAQDIFLKHVLYRLKSDFSFLDFQALANLSATSRTMRVKCNEIWSAFVSSEIPQSIALKDYLPKWHNVSWMYSYSLSKGLMHVLRSMDHESREKRFLEAAKNGHLHTLNVLIEEGVALQTQDLYGHTALTLAATHVKPAVTQSILYHLRLQDRIDLRPFYMRPWNIARHKVYEAHLNNRYNLRACLENANHLATLLPRSERMIWNIQKREYNCVRYTALYFPCFPCCCCYCCGCKPPQGEEWRDTFLRIEDWCKCCSVLS